MAKLLILQPNTDSIGRQSIPTTLISALLKKMVTMLNYLIPLLWIQTICMIKIPHMKT